MKIVNVDVFEENEEEGLCPLLMWCTKSGVSWMRSDFFVNNNPNITFCGTQEQLEEMFDLFWGDVGDAEFLKTLIVEAE